MFYKSTDKEIKGFLIKFKGEMIMFTQKVSRQIVFMFKRETKDARKIAKILDLPRRDVMAFLQLKGFREYSEGSYL